jgi:hypothetical protein
VRSLLAVFHQKPMRLLGICRDYFLACGFVKRLNPLAVAFTQPSEELRIGAA